MIPAKINVQGEEILVVIFGGSNRLNLATGERDIEVYARDELKTFYVEFGDGVWVPVTASSLSRHVLDTFNRSLLEATSDTSFLETVTNFDILTEDDCVRMVDVLIYRAANATFCKAFELGTAIPIDHEFSSEEISEILRFTVQRT